MDKLYVFAVGGSGERVMNSLVMLLAAGMEVGANEIVPVFIDNDVNSHALKTSLERIEYYNGELPEKIGFYKICDRARTSTPSRKVSYCRVKIDAPIVLSENQNGAAIGNLYNVIGTLDDDKKSFVDEIKIERDLLFTEGDLKMPLDVGFIGNPNVGSVVMNCTSLNKKKKSESNKDKTKEYKDFSDIYHDVQSTDGVIVVGSLFGGTGASGIPLIVNRFMEKNNSRPILAGLAILPYFTFAPGDLCRNLRSDVSEYDVFAESFDSKTRAALIYYDQYMKQLDYLYYVGDGDNKAVYEHHKGGNEQENPTHIVEMMSALSIIDFTFRGKTDDDSVIYKTPIWETLTNDDRTLNLSGIQQNILSNSLIKFQMMKSIFDKKGMMDFYIRENALFVESIAFKTDLLQKLLGENEPKGEDCWGLWHLFREWEDWLSQLQCNSNSCRAFRLFNNKAAKDSNNIKDDITKCFYTERSEDEKDFGIADFTMSGGIFSKKKKEPKKPEIMKALIKACKDAGDANRDKVDADSDSLPKMISYISEAIDEIINNSCLIGKIM